MCIRDRRGTIDLVHGCKGSVGSEQETVLLADERVANRTVPVIPVSYTHLHDGEGDELFVAQARHKALEVGAGEGTPVHELVEPQQGVPPQVGLSLIHI